MGPQFVIFSFLIHLHESKIPQICKCKICACNIECREKEKTGRSSKVVPKGMQSMTKLQKVVPKCSVSFPSPQERLLNLFAFYFGVIHVDFSRFALYFGGIWLCIPIGTTFEQKTYVALPQEQPFVASSCSASPQGQLSSFSLFFLFLCTRWCMLRFYIYIFGGYCSHGAK